jgi:hypothetical protein
MTRATSGTAQVGLRRSAAPHPKEAEQVAPPWAGHGQLRGKGHYRGGAPDRGPGDRPRDGYTTWMMSRLADLQDRISVGGNEGVEKYR